MSESVRVALSEKANNTPVTAATLTPAQVNNARCGTTRAHTSSGADDCGCNESASQEHARHLAQMRNLPEVRAERIAAIKRMIDEGTFDTETRLAQALDRMFEELRQH